jgi:hypothetical protein
MANLLDENKHRVLGSRSALFEQSPTLVEKTGVLPARAVVDGSSGLVPVRLLWVSSPSKLYKGKTLDKDIPVSQPVTAMQPNSLEQRRLFGQADV